MVSSQRADRKQAVGSFAKEKERNQEMQGYGREKRERDVKRITVCYEQIPTHSPHCV